MEGRAENVEEVLSRARDLAAAGRLPEARSLWQLAIEQSKDSQEACCRVGWAMHEFRLFDEAIAHYRKAADSPKLAATAHNNMGVALRSKGEHALAASHFAEACRRAPNSPAFRTNLANAIRACGDAISAIAHYRASIALTPTVDAHTNLGTLLNRLGRTDQAEQEFASAIEVEPGCAQAHSNLLFLRTHQSGRSAGSLLDMHRNFGAIHDSASNAIEPHSVHKDQADAPIRLGFVSADLRKHPVAVMLQSVWPWLVSDPRLQVFVYYTHPHSDAVTATFKCDRVEWRDVATDSDETLCRLIRADRIDILIDLSGHTAGNRLPVFGRKPAPVQMSWLGYPFSTGLKTMDYYICDKKWVDDAVAESCFVEKMLRLPVATTFDPPPEAPPVGILPLATLKHPTFGCLSRTSKINTQSMEVWSQILRIIPHARMIIGGISDRDAPKAIALYLHGRGIDPSRLDFHSRLPMTQFLSLHSQIDFLLDTFPYGGGSTTLYGAWMGCPTLTLEGCLPQTRQSSAVMRHLSLDEFVVKSIDDLPMAADYICQSADLLFEVRDGLRQRLRSSAICNPEQLAAALVVGLKRAWTVYLDGNHPKDISTEE